MGQFTTSKMGNSIFSWICLCLKRITLTILARSLKSTGVFNSLIATVISENHRRLLKSYLKCLSIKKNAIIIPRSKIIHFLMIKGYCQCQTTKIMKIKSKYTRVFIFAIQKWIQVSLAQQSVNQYSTLNRIYTSFKCRVSSNSSSFMTSWNRLSSGLGNLWTIIT
jgi:hypothetical protein